MKDLILDRALPDEERCQSFYFALAKASEDQGNYFDAFGYLEKGGDLRKSLPSYRIEDDKHYFNCIKKNAAKFQTHRKTLFGY